MMKQFLLYVSLLVLLCFSTIRADEEGVPEGIEMEGDGDNKIIKLSREKAKREGWLPWDQWYEEDEYTNFKKVMQQFFKPMASSGALLEKECKNITWMSQEKYEYFFRNYKESTIDPNTTTVVIMGSTHSNTTMWIAIQI